MATQTNVQKRPDLGDLNDSDMKPGSPTIEVVAISKGIRGRGTFAHVVEPGTKFRIKKGETGSWFRPVDASVELPLSKAQRLRLARAEIEAQERDRKASQALAQASTMSAMTRAQVAQEDAIAEKKTLKA